jgi:hypothetical protein
MASTHDRTQEDHLRDVDRVLLYISQARVKAEEIAEALAKDGAEERLSPPCAPPPARWPPNTSAS